MVIKSFKVYESESHKDPHISELEDIFADISDNTEIQIVSNLNFSVMAISNIIHKLGLIGFNKRVISHHPEYKDHLQPTIKKYFYKVIIKYNKYDKGDLKDKMVIHNQIKILESRYSKYGNFEFYSWWSNDKTYDWHITMFRNKENLITEISNAMDELRKNLQQKYN